MSNGVWEATKKKRIERCSDGMSRGLKKMAYCRAISGNSLHIRLLEEFLFLPPTNLLQDISCTRSRLFIRHRATHVHLAFWGRSVPAYIYAKRNRERKCIWAAMRMKRAWTEGNKYSDSNSTRPFVSHQSSFSRNVYTWSSVYILEYFPCIFITVFIEWGPRSISVYGSNKMGTTHSFCTSREEGNCEGIK